MLDVVSEIIMSVDGEQRLEENVLQRSVNFGAQ